jgi:hypothetical protein
MHYEYAGHVENIKKILEGRDVSEVEQEGI